MGRSGDDGVVITIGLATGDDDAVREAALVLAGAVAARDGGEPDVRRAEGGLRGRLRQRGAQLLLAQDGPRVVGLACVVPTGPGTAELYYLAVDADLPVSATGERDAVREDTAHGGVADGDVVAAALLGAVRAVARHAGSDRVETSVAASDDVARRRHEDDGWVADAPAEDADVRYTAQL